MGPDKNSELFSSVAESRLPSIKEEYIRISLLAESLRELSGLFADKETTSHPVTEPTLLPRLYALSQVQRSAMGISGFEPMLAVNTHEQPNGSIDAKAAPAHDEFGENGSYFRTRVINITMPNSYYADMVEIFGINVYQPSIDEREIDDTNEKSGIILVGQRGEVRQTERPITGETVVFAVRNKITEDAKLYKVAFAEEGDTPLRMGPGVDFQSETYARVYLPDGRDVVVELLGGELLQQALDELQAASVVLNNLHNPESLLTEHERTAAKETMARSGDSGGEYEP